MTTTTHSAAEYSFGVSETGVDIHWQGQTLTIEATDLRDGGWEHNPTCERDHCGDGDCAPCPYCDDGHTPSAGLAMERWHAEQGHPGRLDLCHEQPCHMLADAMGLHE